jgi:endo-1,4-beta-D-glucanase Y
MKRRSIKCHLAIFLWLTAGMTGLGPVALVFAEIEPYPFGVMPAGRNPDHAREVYRQWKAQYVTAEGSRGFRRVIDPGSNGATYSEGIGYGMLLAAYSGDRALFDDLWGYYGLNLNNNGLMHYRIEKDGRPESRASATDGDLDVAFALVVAHARWKYSGGIDYHRPALEMIHKIRQHEIEESTWVLKPGDGPGWVGVTNPSYFSPAYFRVFQALSGDRAWEAVAEKCYDILKKSANSETGLVPDWCTPEGAPVPDRSYGYGWDACRTPWRIALDYLWFGSKAAADFCTPITRFAERIGSKNIATNYYLNGRPTGRRPASAFLGPLAVASMATHRGYQVFCDESYRDTVALSADNYYNLSWKALSLFTQTGQFYNPMKPTTPRKADGSNIQP